MWIPIADALQLVSWLITHNSFFNKVIIKQSGNEIDCCMWPEFRMIQTTLLSDSILTEHTWISISSLKQNKFLGDARVARNGTINKRV
jgi:hypothetical protein